MTKLMILLLSFKQIPVDRDDCRMCNLLWAQKITIALLKNRLSLNFIIPNIESAAIPNNKTIAPKKYLYQFGYAIWWGTAPRIIDTFVESYDFSSKTIIPFCTSGGSGIRTAESDLRKLCNGNPTWKKGRRFEGGASQSTVNEWVDSQELK